MMKKTIKQLVYVLALLVFTNANAAEDCCSDPEVSGTVKIGDSYCECEWEGPSGMQQITSIDLSTCNNIMHSEPTANCTFPTVQDINEACDVAKEVSFTTINPYTHCSMTRCEFNFGLTGLCQFNEQKDSGLPPLVLGDSCTYFSTIDCRCS